MKIGLATNILVRYITNDIPMQADQVESLFNSFGKDAVFAINDVVLAELDWVLTNVYDYSKEDFLKTIHQLLDTANIVFDTPLLIKEACELYSKNSADFADCLIGVLNKDQNCKTTYTFDKKASNLPSFTLLK